MSVTEFLSEHLDAEQIYDNQRSTALKYQLVMPVSEGQTPLETYEGLLSEYGLLYLPSVIMSDLVSHWRMESTLRLTGNAILASSKAINRANQ
jgi:hypothetical protein